MSTKDDLQITWPIAEDRADKWLERLDDAGYEGWKQKEEEGKFTVWRKR